LRPPARTTAQPSDDAVRKRVLELVAQVTASPVDSLKPEHRLGTELGFDSLMATEIYASLIENFPEARKLPQEIMVGETSIEELVRAVTEVISRVRHKA